MTQHTSGFGFIQAEALPSPARRKAPAHPPLRVGVVQHAWRPDADALARHLTAGIGRAADAGARIVFLPELTLVRYPADQRAEGRAADAAEDLPGGPTFAFAAAAARAHGVYVHASLYERAAAPDGTDDGLGYNTAIIVSPEGELVARTRKLHIPKSDGYYEDTYFRHGPADDPYPVHRIPALAGAGFGLPTCYDEWFPEVARVYAVKGADIVVYPTAIGTEINVPGFDSQPMWQHVITSHAITNALFVIAPNRIGTEPRRDGTPGSGFYGSSFIADPYGRIVVQAPRDAETVLVADLDLGQRTDWAELFPFLPNRRPDTYAALCAAVDRNGRVATAD